MTPNDPYSGRTASLTSKFCILYIYSTNKGTEYFKRGIYCLLFPSSKCSLFHKSHIFGSCFIHILYTGCAKIKKLIIPAPKVNPFNSEDGGNTLLRNACFNLQCWLKKDKSEHTPQQQQQKKELVHTKNSWLPAFEVTLN